MYFLEEIQKELDLLEVLYSYIAKEIAKEAKDNVEEQWQ